MPKPKMLRVVFMREEEGKKTVWPQVGVAFQGDGEEKMTVILNSIPLTSQWDGKLYLLPIDQEYAGKRKPYDTKKATVEHMHTGEETPEDDLPF